MVDWIAAVLRQGLDSVPMTVLCATDGRTHYMLRSLGILIHR